MSEDDKAKNKEVVVGGASSVVDIHSPYHLHASDHPGQIFVPDLLNDTNYGEWASDMTEVLFAKNKFGFVDKTIERPADGDKELPYWQRCDALVRGWLKSSMSSDLRRSVRYAITAAQIWEDLKDHFEHGSAPRTYELKRALSLLRQEDLGVSAYYTKQRALWDELQAISPPTKCTCGGCNCGSQQKQRDSLDKEHLYLFLMGLSDTFSGIKSHILSQKPTPTLAQ